MSSSLLIARERRKIGAHHRVLALLAAVAACACAQIQSELRALEPPPAPAQHAVRTGETLTWIAEGYGISVEQLARANHLRPGDRVEPGRRLVIPDGARIVHRVKRGDTLQQIADHYDVRVSTISSVNRLGLYPRIEVGQRLLMPREAKLPPPPAAFAAARPKRARAVSAAPPREAAAAARPQPAANANLNRATELVDGAVADYRAARFQSALERAQQAEALLAESKDRDARRVGARAAFVTASVHAANGDSDRAKDSFTRVHSLDPDFEPPEGWLSPRLEQLYIAAREE
jgi:LysM repeat protein